jgi:hypothetical protein
MDTVTEIVRPATPTSDRPPWVLKAHDRANLLLILRGTWIFDQDLDAARIADGLARLLDLYPHLAGRMVRGQRVEFADEGVTFTEAHRPALTVAQASEQRAHAERFHDPMTQGRVRAGKQAPLAVRLTHLADGCVLGMRCSHACLDGRGFYTMARNLACLVTSRPFPEPVLDQTLLADPPPRPKAKARDAMRAAGWVQPSLWDIVRILPAMIPSRMNQRSAPVHFTAATLGRLKHAAADRSSVHAPSTNLALCAHLASLWPDLHDLDEVTDCAVVVVIDARRRHTAFPDTFAGNAALPCPAARFPAGAPLGELVDLIHAGLSPYLQVPSPIVQRDLSLALEIVRHKLLLMPFDLPRMHLPRPDVLYINNFARMPIYDLDFGTADAPIRPVLAIPHDLPDPVLIWPAPPGQDGVEVYFTGVAARAVATQSADGVWWTRMRRFGG